MMRSRNTAAYSNSKRFDASFLAPRGIGRAGDPGGDCTCSGEVNSPCAKVLPGAKRLRGASAAPLCGSPKELKEAVTFL